MKNSSSREQDLVITAITETDIQGELKFVSNTEIVILWDEIKRIEARKPSVIKSALLTIFLLAVLNGALDFVEFLDELSGEDD